MRVEECLPPDSKKVLVLCKGYRFAGSGPLCQKSSYHIFEGSFNRRYGWHVPYHPENDACVIGWMPKPRDLDESQDPI